jgi:hypothetical protein
MRAQLPGFEWANVRSETVDSSARSSGVRRSGMDVNGTPQLDHVWGLSDLQQHQRSGRADSRK